MEKYQILDQVGEGTYGSVWRAVNKATKSLVAIKVFHTIDDEGLSRSAIQELKFLQALKGCEGVIRLEESFLSEGKLAVVFPFADSDLTGLCDCGPKLNIEEVKCIMKQMIGAIAKIHSFNLIHRDLKSANILYHQGKVYVGDVGMMTQHERNKHHDPSLITRWYRAPELLLGKTNYGVEVDMWSVGCIMVEVITKQTPFPGMDERHQMDRIFAMIGTPTKEAWGEEVTTLPGWKNLRHGLYKNNNIRTTFKDWDVNALDLLEKLWSPPNTRISAEEALKHPFFTCDPLPCDYRSLPRVPSVHEYEVKKRRQQQQGGPDNKRQRPPNGMPGSHGYANPTGQPNHFNKPPAVHQQRQPIQQRTTNGIAKTIMSQHPERTTVHGKRMLNVPTAAQ